MAIPPPGLSSAAIHSAINWKVASRLLVPPNGTLTINSLWINIGFSNALVLTHRGPSGDASYLLQTFVTGQAALPPPDGGSSYSYTMSNDGTEPEEWFLTFWELAGGGSFNDLKLQAGITQDTHLGNFQGSIHFNDSWGTPPGAPMVNVQYEATSIIESASLNSAIDPLNAIADSIPAYGAVKFTIEEHGLKRGHGVCLNADRPYLLSYFSPGQAPRSVAKLYVNRTANAIPFSVSGWEVPLADQAKSLVHQAALVYGAPDPANPSVVSCDFKTVIDDGDAPAGVELSSLKYEIVKY
jgi:hypothetical protein